MLRYLSSRRSRTIVLAIVVLIAAAVAITGAHLAVTPNGTGVSTTFPDPSTPSPRSSTKTDAPSPGADADDPLTAAVESLKTRQLTGDDEPSPAAAEGGVEEPGKPVDEAPLYESRTNPVPQGKIDELVFGKLQQLGITPAQLCSDAVFVRRVYLDIIGTLPSAQEVREFIESQEADKRDKLIDRLLARPEFADYWAMKWSDLLRIKSEFPINLWPNAAQAYHRWVRAALRDNMPYDEFVRQLLAASGSNFRVPQVNFYRALQNKEPATAAKAVALAFMGARAEKWPPERLAGTAVFFSQIGYKPTGEWKEEIVIFDPSKGKPKPGTEPVAPMFPDGTAATIPPDHDPRVVFADWLITPQNPWFTRHIVNRVWYWLLGRGIVHEPDDIRAGNPPSNPELLKWLGSELVTARYDLKHIYRLVLRSQTYQLSCVPRSDDPQAAAQFAYYPLRRLEAEVLIDALCQISGTTESYSSMIPEPFTFIPEDCRSIALPDGSITSSFLEMFGRPPRDTGLELERNNRITASQWLHLLNSSHVRRTIQEGPAMRQVMSSAGGAQGMADALYLTILSRFPTKEERAIVEGHCGSQSGGQTVAWALINSDEFLHRH
jgi:hypothetical protein